MKNYELLELEEGKEYRFIVLSTNYISPTECLNDIEQKLAKIGCNGKILFDFLLANGNSSNRFCTIHFDGEKFDLDSLAIVNPKDYIKQMSLDFYREHVDLIKNSILDELAVEELFGYDFARSMSTHRRYFV